MRLDKFLFYARLAKTRTLAQTVLTDGHVRIDGAPALNRHAIVRTGNVVTLPIHGRVRVIRVEALPSRRGPADEAQLCYTELSPD